MLETMSEEGFKRHIRSLVLNKLQKDKNLSEETSRYWTHILSGHYDFTQAEDEAEEMERVTLEEVKRFFAKSILPDSPRSKKMSIHVRSQKLVDEKLQLAEGTVTVEDLEWCRAGLELSGVPSPAKDLSHFASF